jgi:hypothetical protein
MNNKNRKGKIMEKLNVVKRDPVQDSIARKKRKLALKAWRIFGAALAEHTKEKKKSAKSIRGKKAA